MNKKKAIIPFFKNPIIRNLAMIIVTGVILILVTLLFLHFYTRHGQNIVVPKLDGLQVNEASTILNAKGLSIEIVDSIYNRNAVPGSIMDQSPKANNKVKEGRSIYVTIFSKNPQQIAVPGLVDYSSRQALALLNSLGFTQISIEHVPSEFSGLVMAVEYKGKPLTPDEKIPAGSSLNLVVSSNQLSDSLDVNGEHIIDPVQLEDQNLNNSSESGKFDESFF